MKIGLIVEGHGEVQALPVLLRRLAHDLSLAPRLHIPPPLRVSRGKILKEPELRRAVDFMARKTSPDGSILVVLDADDDCPAELAPRLLSWASDARTDRNVAVVIAKAEFEAWFLASAVSLRGVRGLPHDLVPPEDPESLRNAKGWLDGHLPNGYSATIDQSALAAVFDWKAALASPSFDKLVRDLRRLLETSRAG